MSASAFTLTVTLLVPTEIGVRTTLATVKVPVGEYDREALLNVGTHYWSTIPQVAAHAELFGRLYFAQFQAAESITSEQGDARSSPMWEAVVDRTGRSFGFHFVAQPEGSSCAQ